MNMKKKTKPQEMVAYDFSNLDVQENSKGNCYGCDAVTGGCDMDNGGGTCDTDTGLSG